MAETPLTGDAALVTGAGSGIGRASALGLAEAGADVALADIDADALQDIASTIRAEYDRETVEIPTDVRDVEAVEAMVETAVDTLDKLDIVVNNAGMGFFKTMEETTTDEYHQLMDTNTDGMFFTARAVAPHLRETEGNLIFMASMAGEFPRPKAPVYAASKWWTRGFAHSIEGPLGEDGVAVTTICPTEVRTQFGSEQGTPLEDAYEEDEAIAPEDVGDAVVYAATQDPPNTVSELSLYERSKLSHF